MYDSTDCVGKEFPVPTKPSSLCGSVLTALEHVDEDDLRKIAGDVVSRLTGFGPRTSLTIIDRVAHLQEDHGCFSQDVMRLLNPPKHGCG